MALKCYDYAFDRSVYNSAAGKWLPGPSAGRICADENRTEEQVKQEAKAACEKPDRPKDPNPWCTLTEFRSVAAPKPAPEVTWADVWHYIMRHFK